MRLLTCTALALAAAALGGCSTLVSGGGSEDIAVSTPSVSGATCVLSNLKGSWTVQTPAVANVQRGLEDLQVKCTKPGYDEAWTNLASSWDPWTLGNIASLGIGFGADVYTDALHVYPHAVELPMQPATPAAPPAPETAPQAAPAG